MFYPLRLGTQHLHLHGWGLWDTEARWWFHPGWKKSPVEVGDVEVPFIYQGVYMDVSENNGTPKSSILIGVSIIFTIHFGVPLFWEPPICFTWWCSSIWSINSMFSKYDLKPLENPLSLGNLFSWHPFHCLTYPAIKYLGVIFWPLKVVFSIPLFFVDSLKLDQWIYLRACKMGS